MTWTWLIAKLIGLALSVPAKQESPSLMDTSSGAGAPSCVLFKESRATRCITPIGTAPTAGPRLSGEFGTAHQHFFTRSQRNVAAQVAARVVSMGGG